MNRLACFLRELPSKPGLRVTTDVCGFDSIDQAPFMLFRHFFTVALYSIWVLFTHPRQVGVVDGKPIYRRPRPDEYPFLAFKSLQVVRIYIPSLYLVLMLTRCDVQFWTACVVFMPLLWTEIRP